MALADSRATASASSTSDGVQTVGSGRWNDSVPITASKAKIGVASAARVPS
jgi:hypothetical protein